VANGDRKKMRQFLDANVKRPLNGLTITTATAGKFLHHVQVRNHAEILHSLPVTSHCHTRSGFWL
jgi:hypothetical protein